MQLTALVSLLCAASWFGQASGARLRVATSVSSGIRLRFNAGSTIPALSRRFTSLERDVALHADSTAAITMQTMCPFSVDPPPMEEWSDSKATNLFDSFLASFMGAGLAVELTDGTLLGAYRHHGTIPHDMDMDAIFNVCRFARINNITGSKSPLSGMSCTKIKEKRNSMGNSKFDEWVWREALAPSLEDKGVSYIEQRDIEDKGAYDAGKWHNSDPNGMQEMRISNGEHQWNGGWPDMAGVGMDLHITTDDETDDRLCKCTYGRSAAYCPRASKNMLAKEYGADFMVPLSQCDYYAGIAKRDHHDNWNAVSHEDCKWAETARKELLLTQKHLRGL